MRNCDGCTLCCKIPTVEPIKTSNCLCPFAAQGIGCAIYYRRPKVCKEFQCAWLAGNLPEQFAPKQHHLYVAGNLDPDLMIVRVDPDRPDAWKGNAVVEWLLKKGKHVLVIVGDQINFLQSSGQARPKKVMIDWTL